MNFSFDASKTQQSGVNPQNPTPGIQGSAGAGDAGKMLSTGFGQSMQPQAKPSLFGSTLGGTPAPSFGWGLGAPAAGGQTPGLNLAGSAASTPAPTSASTPAPAATLNFSMGSTPAAPTGFSGFSTAGLGTTGASSTPGGLSFTVPKPAATQAPSGFSLGGGTATSAASNPPKLTFGTTAPAATTNTGFSLGGTAATPAATTAATSFSLATPATTTTQQLGLTIVAPTTNVADTANRGFGVTPTTGTTLTTAYGGFPALGNVTSRPTTGFNVGTSAAPTISSSFTLNKTTAAQPATTAATATTSAPQTTLGTVTTVSSASSGQTGTINFCQLEESINKWTLELEEQEKAFVNQATQVNNWDKLLIANGEKIATLNQEVERVKLEQQHLEHELDYVVGQQKELQDCLVPLEKELASLSVADPERDYTYRLAENLDKQLKTMSQDLKEIIEHLNEANRSQDSSDPIVQIGKILNAHMNSLQWLDQRTSVLGQKIQQIDQMHQNFRQENERSFSLAYN